MVEFSKETLLSWGLLKHIYKQQIIDAKIIDIKEPDNSKMKNIFSNWLSKNGISSNDALKNWQTSKGISSEIWEKLVLRDWKWEMWCRNHFSRDLDSYYLKRKPMLDLITYSLIRTKKESLALELFLRIKEKEADFKDLANTYSEGPESKTGGVIGPVTIKQTHPILAKILLISQKNQLWPPKKIDEWWVIVRLEELKNTEFNERTALMLSLELGDTLLDKEANKLNNSLIKSLIKKD